MKFETNRYGPAGWDVKSVESLKLGYDLECKKGRLLEHVEVKGTKGSELAFVITENEVIKARNDPAFRLSVVTNVVSDSEETAFTGAEFLRQFERRTIQYFARFVDSSA